MIRAIATRGRRGAVVSAQRADVRALPAPTGGWNARDAVTDMAEADAVTLDNWFPETDAVKVRAGSARHATGLGSAVESMFSWNGPASSKMFGAAGANVYEVTSAGAVGAAAFGSMTSARWQHVMFANSAGNFLYLVNGADAPRYYDGTSWTAPAITGSGLTATNLVNVTSFRFRLFFCENNKLGFWYFPVEAIGGAISYYNLAPLCKAGGFLMAMGTWTHDGGDGVDDVLVCVTSKGEAVLFRGTNPGDASSWAYIGTFNVGEPIGRRCMAQLGADLVIITRDGVAPISRFLAGGRLSKRAAVSDKIRGAITGAVKDNGSRFGWQPIVYPNGNMVLFNSPVSSSAAVQFVSNTTTGAWARFKDMNANCWALLNDELYFGGSGTVFKADTGLDDDGAEIKTEAETAFSYLGNRGLLKQITLARPIFKTNGTVGASVGISVDYATGPLTSSPVFSAPTSSAWDTSPWDTTPWGDADRLVKDWYTVGGIGRAASIRLKTTSRAGRLRWLASEVAYQPVSSIL